ncbi:peptidyl-glycine alpha-amidating monooxygenase B-like isoform X2 [Lineus longissimus]|uniref:peptidyl-glycine alpha-amidating monooxygenase B-like isoform X2 n=1 Tax=Lineus longissimus TaxID=88925 RepID=UPI002B4CB6A0
MFTKRIPQILTALGIMLTLTPAAVVERTATPRKGVKDDTHTTKIQMRMPATHPDSDDSYLCTSVQLPSAQKKQYIIQYKPSADDKTVHHMLLFGCSKPESMEKKWNCRGACTGKSVIMYAWPKHAPNLILPDGVGFAVGGDTNVDYLVLQIHYAFKFKAEQKADISGMDITLTSVVQPYIAGIYLLYSVYDNIPPRTNNYDIPVSCQFKADVDEIHPFAFRPHAHDLATSITGYLKNATSTYVIGQGDPQLPQAFYPIEQQFTIKPNDYVAAICSYNSMNRNTGTSIGSHHADEMCNFYMMYYTKNTPKAKSYYQCTGNNYPEMIQNLPHVDAPSQIMKKQGKYPTVGRNDRQGYDSEHDPYQGYESDYRYAPQRKDYSNDYYNNYDLSNQRSRGRGQYRDYDLPNPEPQQYDSDYGNLLSGLERTYFQNGGQDLLAARSTLAPPINPPLSVKSHANKPGVRAKSRLQPTNKVNVGGSGGGKVVVETKAPEKTITLETTGLPPPIKVEFVHDWPSKDAQSKLKLGQVSGVTTVGNGDVIIFQRGKRVWDGTAFKSDETLTEHNRFPIKEKTIIRFNKAGDIMDQWGENFFYMPHGIHMDKKGNLWITDVGMHQVFRFDAGMKVKPSLVLGEFLKPGKDDKHFCKPSDVAALDNGDFFVTDGYCNTRVMKFDTNGKLLKKWGNPSLGIEVPPANAFYIPHSITLVEDKKEVCVADRENGRVQCFDYDGKFLRKLKPKEIGDRLFAISYSPKAGGVLYAVNGPDFYSDKQPVAGFTMQLETGQVLQTWEPSTKTIKSLANPHDVAVTRDGDALYVAEIGPNKIWKFRINEISKGEISYRKLLPNKTKKINEPAAWVSGDGRKTVDNHDDLAGGDMSASMIIGALLIVPIIVIIIVTVIIRLRKSGKLRFNKNYKNRKNKLNLGSFFGRHKGFDQLSQDDSEHELDHPSDSEVEEYTASTQKEQLGDRLGY